MKTNLLKLISFTAFAFLFALQVNAQCKKVSLIGAFNEWNGDFYLERNLDNPDEFSGIFTLADTSELKFRAGADWATNWGSDDGFPTGVGVLDGSNLLVPSGTYLVTFNCATAAYNFQTTCGEIGIVGAFSGWGADADAPLVRDATNPDMWSGMFTLVDSSEIKFRMNADWATNWGSDDGFPTGTGVQDGANLVAPPGSYFVTFNCSTAAYNFQSTCGEIGIVGAFSGWGADADAPLVRDATNPDMWSGMFTLVDSSEIKFRMNADWATNWGSDDGFPTGIGVQDGANLVAPPGSYFVTFNCSTAAYNFQSTCGDVSMIGAFNGWNGDVEMNRDVTDPNMWTLYRSWNKDSQVKFRQNKDWAVNWGNDTWPSGTATDNGPNIPLVAGKYDISFNCSTGDYNFVTNDSYCGEIGMVGDFNEWGADDADGFYTDALLKRDANHPGNYTLTYTFGSATNLLFREDGDLTFTNVWGGTFPSGTGEKDPSKFLEVPGGTYNITFNCLSGDFNFKRLGSSIYAPKVFTINVDGAVDENDWNINEPVSKLIDGAAGDDPNETFWGAAYNDEFLFVAGLVKDSNIELLDGASINVDGDKSGGAFDEHDISIDFDANTGTVIINHGPDGYTPDVKTSMTADGWSFEAGISWSKLGVTPVSGNQIAMEIGIQDVDGTNTAKYTWNGDGVSGPSSFGAVNLGTLACGDISLYSSAIGDIGLRPTSNDDGTNTNTYVGTYEFESDMNVVFRKDANSTVSWGASDFPGGTAIVGGDQIPATTGRYRVSFGCLDGAYSFTTETAGEGVAYTHFTENAVTLDGDLSEYNLEYGMDAGVVAGNGPDNNTVKWGSVWDANNVYFGVEVTDAVVEGSGNPWDNDAIEFYFDGNHDSDGTYDADFDTQIIMDIVNGDVPWVKADGAPITDIEGKWFATSSGYNLEMRIGWADFGFSPARNRAMGFTIGNNDSDNGIGRDYQTTWYGTADNWNNTSVFGDLQLAGGNLTKVLESLISDQITVYPNPSSQNSGVYVVAGESFNGETTVKIFNLYGQVISNQKVSFNGNAQLIKTNTLSTGTYFLYLSNSEGNQAVKQIIIK